MLNPALLQMLGPLKQNPVGFLLARKFNIPPNIGNDPNAIFNYLLYTGQITQSQINAAYQTFQNGG